MTPAPADLLNWPSLESPPWRATQEYLHAVSQMLGKLRLALAPPLPQWFNASLALSPRGLTTRAMPAASGAVEGSLDLLDHVVQLSSSDGRVETIQLLPPRPIAEVWHGFIGSLSRLEVVADLWDKPQEQQDVTPFSQDDRPRGYDAALATAWLALLLELHWIFDRWRSPFFGRSGVNFWWGGFDLTMTLYNGRHAVPRKGSNYLMRYDLDAEHLSIGFWPGDPEHEATFFGYLVPEPAECAVYPFNVPSAAWARTMGEWVLPYEEVRNAGDRQNLIRGFMDEIYRAAGELAGWDLEAQTYAIPPAAPGRPHDHG